MAYKNTRSCLVDLEKHGHLVRISEEVDPYLEMAAIHRRLFDMEGPAIWFENVKGSPFQACSNLFGTVDRSRFIFRDSLETVKQLIGLKGDPGAFFKAPWKFWKVPFIGMKALPLKARLGKPVLYGETTIDQLPQIQSWPMDGGPFVTLPLVYSEDPDKPGVMASNLGMYRIQLGGNDYVQNEEIGLHYQLHRGIGVHQTKSNRLGQDFKVSIFVGGPPSHNVAAVMPLPEGLPEVAFAGALGNRNFRYTHIDGFGVSTEADFVISGIVRPGENKPEGPFGDHLGYYSLTHDFPLMRVHKVWHRKNAIWPFTVVGRPPQEDTSFGALIHEMTGPVIPSELPGLHDVHAVDASGVHPLLLAIGSERYTPYYNERKPAEILTIANHILGFGQMSLAKYLLIVAKEDDPSLDIHHVDHFLKHMLERIDWTRDLHFHTRTTIDTLDYSGEDLNSGSKVVMAAAGEKIRSLSSAVPAELPLVDGFSAPHIAMEGVLVVQGPSYKERAEAEQQIERLTARLAHFDQDILNSLPLILVVDDSEFTARTLKNFLWVTFTRSNPSHDIHGVNSFTEYKHWGCRGPLVIDARIKPHHAPPLIEDPAVEKRVDQLFAKGGSLAGLG